MATALIIFMLFSSVRLVRSEGLMAPNVVIGLIAFGNAAVYYIYGLCFPSPFAKDPNSEAALGNPNVVMGWIFAVHVIALFSHETSRLSKSPSTADQIAQRPTPLFLFMTLIGCMVLNCLLLAHGLSADWKKMCLYDTYQQISEPAYVGIQSIILILVHRSIQLLGILVFAVLGLACVHRLMVLIVVALPACLYCLAVSSSMGSRSAALQVLIFFLIIAVRYRAKSFWLTIPGFYIAWVAYCTALHVRGGDKHGLYSFAMEFARELANPRGIIDSFMTNVFEGGFVFGRASGIAAEYPSSYKMLSYSFLPSRVDQFNVEEQVRVNASTPFSAVAEVYHFGPAYWVVSAIYLYACLRLLTKLYTAIQRIDVYLILLPAYASFFMLFSYPIRSATKWMTISCIIAFFIILMRRPDKRSSPRRSITPKSNVHEQGEVQCGY